MMYPGGACPEDATPRQRKAHAKAVAAWAAEEAARIERQRLLLSRIGGEVQKALVSAVLDRAWKLLDAGECEAADALLEFVPEAEATALLDEFFDV